MLPKRDNYAIQAEDARRRFLTYDQTAMPAERDDDFLCLPFCGIPYRISRADGHLFRQEKGVWLPADSHGEVLTIYDYLCDVKPGRSSAGEYATITALGGHVHGTLAGRTDGLDRAIEADPDRFCRVCRDLGGLPETGGDLCFSLDLFPELKVLLRFWHGDEDFPPRLDLLWDRNALQFLRYETLWYAAGVLRNRIAAGMES